MKKMKQKCHELVYQGYHHVLLIDRNNVPTMNTIKGTQQFHEVKSGGATNVEGEYILGVSKIPCSCRKCRDPTLENLVCPVSDFADRKEYRVKRIIEEGELEEEVIDLEVGQIEDEEVDIA